MFNSGGRMPSLLFDEEDAMFGNRTEVTDAHDRFANTESQYPYQRLIRKRHWKPVRVNINGKRKVFHVKRVRLP